MRFYPLREQAFAAPLPAARQGCAPGFCFHAGTEAMLPFTGSLGWLVSAFHKTENNFGAV
jgi:hypothetical protein